MTILPGRNETPPPRDIEQISLEVLTERIDLVKDSPTELINNATIRNLRGLGKSTRIGIYIHKLLDF